MRARPVRLAFGLAVWIALVVTVVVGWDDVVDPMMTAGPRFPVAVGAIGLGLLAAAYGWSILNASNLKARSVRAFLVGQSAKYLPAGGAAQALGQIGLTSTGKDDRAAVALSFLVHGAVQVYAAALVALLIALSPAVAGGVVAVIVLFVIAGAPLMQQATVSRLVVRVNRLSSIVRQQIPSTKRIWQSCMLGTVPLVLSGSAFVGLAGLWQTPADGLATIGAFAAAWAVGFLAVPFPAGLGVREAVLASLVSDAPAAQIVGISLLHRFATLVAELLILLVASKGTFISIDRRD